MDALTGEAPPPDGGWEGWVVVGAVAFINVNDQSVLTLSIWVAVRLAINFSGLFIGSAIKCFHPRNVAAIGCMMVSFGMFLCSFGTVTWHFIVGYSLFVGMGLGLIGPSTFIAINSYFSSKRGRAVGISLAGAGLGQVFIPHLVRQCLDQYGFHVAAIAMSLLSLCGLFGTALLKSPSLESADNEMRKMNPQDVQLNSLSEPLGDSSNSAHQKFCQKACHRLVEAMDLELLSDPVFWNIIIGMALVYTSTINFTMLFPNFLQFSVGISSSETATCMSVVAGADILCRLILPWITDNLKMPYRIVFLIGTVGLLTARTALAESRDMNSILSMSILIGVAKSATVINNNLTITGYCHPKKIPGGLGLNMIAKGVLVISIGQVLGWIRDYTQSYVACLHAQNLLLGLVILSWTPEMCYRHHKLNKKVNLTRACAFRDQLNTMNNS